MALEPKRHCPRPNHPAFLGRRCPKCEKIRDEERGNSNSRGYDFEWKKFRREFIKENPICDVVDCFEPVSDVHHIRSLRDGGNKLDKSNCQGLCHRHHSQVTGKYQVKHRK